MLIQEQRKRREASGEWVGVEFMHIFLNFQLRRMGDMDGGG